MSTTQTETAPGLLTLGLACVAGGATLVFDHGDVSRGCRYLSAYYDAPDLLGRIGGCRFGRLHVEVKEQGQATGEWRVWVTRTPERQTYGWDQLTDKARSAFLAEVGLAFSHTRTSAAWLAAFRQRRQYVDPLAEAEQAQRVERWWRAVESLEALVGVGRYSIRMVPVPESGQAARVDVVDRSRDAVGWELIAGEVVDRMGFRKGLVTESGRLVPFEADAPLRGRP